MKNALIEKMLGFAKAKNPYLIRHEKMAELNYIEDKKGYQDFIEHRLYEPATLEYVSAMQAKFDFAPTLLWDFYQVSNGASFFVNPQLAANEIGGFYFMPMQMWQSEEVAWLKSWVAMDDEDFEIFYAEDNDSLEIAGIPPWFDGILVLGGFEASPERFYMPSTGEFAGQIFMFEHDEYRHHRVAESFEAFLSLLVEHPADLMHLCGGNFYYDMIGYGSDGGYISISECYYDEVAIHFDEDEDED